MKTKLFIMSSIALITSISASASTDLTGKIEAQASAVSATAKSTANTNLQVCFEFGKLLGLGEAYRNVSPGARLEKYLNETVALYAVSCAGSRLKAFQREEIAQLADSVAQFIKP